MTTQMDASKPVFDICMAGFILSNTLSENGGVTRGICEVDSQNHLQRVIETYDIQEKDGIDIRPQSKKSRKSPYSQTSTYP